MLLACSPLLSRASPAPAIATRPGRALLSVAGARARPLPHAGRRAAVSAGRQQRAVVVHAAPDDPQMYQAAEDDDSESNMALTNGRRLPHETRFD